MVRWTGAVFCDADHPPEAVSRSQETVFTGIMISFRESSADVAAVDQEFSGGVATAGCRGRPEAPRRPLFTNEREGCYISLASALLIIKALWVNGVVQHYVVP